VLYWSSSTSSLCLIYFEMPSANISSITLLTDFKTACMTVCMIMQATLTVDWNSNRKLMRCYAAVDIAADHAQFLQTKRRPRQFCYCTVARNAFGSHCQYVFDIELGRPYDVVIQETFKLKTDRSLFNLDQTDIECYMLLHSSVTWTGICLV
jgi:hypothetical protein